MSVRRLASAKVVVPAESAMAVPGCTRLAAAPAMRVLLVPHQRRLQRQIPARTWNCLRSPPRRRAPSRSALARAGTPDRGGPSCPTRPGRCTRSETRTALCSRTCSRISACRCRARAGLLAVESRACVSSLTRPSLSGGIASSSSLNGPAGAGHPIAIVPQLVGQVNVFKHFPTLLLHNPLTLGRPRPDNRAILLVHGGPRPPG